MSNATKNVISTEEIITAITAAVADKIQGYNVYTCDDGGGAYISLNSISNDEDYRCISLADIHGGGCPEDLSVYCWNFWNHEANLYFDSTLGASATVDEVLGFLNESLATENARKR